MADLSENARKGVHAEIMQEMSHGNEACGITKAELRAAVDGIDDWVNDNAASLNSAIPQPARGQLTSAQKARITARVMLRRYADGA